MRSVSYYVNAYGFNGWKSTLQTEPFATDSALAAMLRDELATPGLTDLSKLPRYALTALAQYLPASAYTNTFIASGELMHLGFDTTQLPPPNTSPTDSLQAIMSDTDARYLQTPIKFLHGGENNPFRLYTDVLNADGTVTSDTVGAVDTELLTAYYLGAYNYVLAGTDITQQSPIITSKTIFTNLLKQVVETGVATATEVQQKFGNYMPDVVTAALEQVVVEDQLPRWAALDDANANFAFKAYLAYFGRPPDPGGLSSWVDHLKDPNYTIDNLIEIFGNSAESNSLYSNVSSTARVEAIYHYLFNREPEQEGRDFWVGAIDSGNLSMAGAALHILNGARNDARHSDLTVVNEKIEAARAFVESLDTQREVDLYVGATAALGARKYLSAINADSAHNDNVVQIVGQVINALNGNVDNIFTVHGIALGYY